jgi:deoxyribonuclease (pyrimidine dimer)
MRINVIPVSELLDQHLIAEYREIKMLPKMLCRSLAAKKAFDLCDVPIDYTLNKGHGKFFYNKLCFIIDRFDALLSEMVKRGFSVNSEELFYSDYDYSLIFNFSKFDLFGNYLPTAQALKVNRDRIALRVFERPGFYRYYGKKL